MTLNSDLTLHHPLWERADSELKDALGIFGRLIDIFILACSIGVRADKMITSFENGLENPKTIGRNTIFSLGNTNLKESLDFLLQNILITSENIKYDLDERLKLAFDPDYSIPKLSAAGLLIGFANYGLEQIFEHLDSGSSLMAITQLHDYLETLHTENEEEILGSITLEEIIQTANEMQIDEEY